MKLRNRILAVLLTLAMVLAMVPAVFAADKVTVTLISPTGSKEETLSAGSYFTFPQAEEYEGYQFSGWTSEPVKATDGTDLKDFYYPGEEHQMNESMTFYALYAYKHSDLEEPCFYWTANLDDYTGEFAIVAYDADFEAEEYLYETPVAMGQNGQNVDVVNDLGATVDVDNYEFYTKATNIVFYFERQNDGTYTICNLDTGKYLSVSGGKMTFVTTPDAYAYWNVVLDAFDYEVIYNAKNENLVLLYDYVDCVFGIFDDSVPYDGEYYPTDFFYINMYARETGIYMFTTEVENGTPVEPTQPTEPDPTESTQPEELPEGYVAIYNVADSVVMTIEASVFNNKEQLLPAPATLKGGKLSVTSDKVALFQMETEANGNVSFRTADGKYLEADGTNLRFVDAANENTEFVLEEAENGYCIRLANYVYVDYNGNEKAQYIEYYSDKEVFTVYGMGANLDMYVFDFYPVEEGQEPTEPDPTEPDPTEPEELPERPQPIENHVVIYNIAHGTIMTTESSTYTSSSGSTEDQILPAKATLEGEEVVTDDITAAQFLVESDENGNVTFRLPDGRYLEADGTNLRYVQERNENTEFCLDPVEDGGYYIRLANYVYVDGKTNTEKPQYIEYYSAKEVFTTYGMGTDTSMYIFAFYPLAGETAPEEPEVCEHEWDDGRIIVMPTCEKAGVKILTCTKCGETKEVEAGMILCASARFEDLDPKAWYHLGVDDMLGRGLMNGMSETEFRPNVTLNRAMVATVLYRLAGEPAVEGESNFTDVDADAWFAKAVAWAQAEGIVTGYTDNTFRPFKQITRQEMAVMLARYAKNAGYIMDTEMDLSAYPDADSVAQWAEASVIWAVENGLINGILTEGTSYLKPGNNATRAQFATIMSRFLEGR
ncbi:MAG: S-layer homology domain-containing protein [Oscillospiraceae bacterium]|nr:S-layer homology domain-containing protein [Oscillospiraceae bacterium]